MCLIKLLICYSADSHLPAPKLWAKRKKAYCLFKAASQSLRIDQSTIFQHRAAAVLTQLRQREREESHPSTWRGSQGPGAVMAANMYRVGGKVEGVVF